MNGQEVAIRLMALVWSAQVFASAAASTPRRRARLAQSVAEHARRIPATLVYARSQNNNHLVTESAALYTAGAVLDNASWRAAWLALAESRAPAPDQHVRRVHPAQHQLSPPHASVCFVGGCDSSRASGELAAGDTRRARLAPRIGCSRCLIQPRARCQISAQTTGP